MKLNEFLDYIEKLKAEHEVIGDIEIGACIIDRDGKAHTGRGQKCELTYKIVKGDVISNVLVTILGYETPKG